jgi:cytochrome b561
MDEPDLQRRPPSLRWLHWATVVPLCLAVAAVLVRDQVEQRDLRAALLWAHQYGGLAVLLLGLIRLPNRWRLRPLPAVAALRWTKIASAVHGVMYMAMVAVPLVGWALATASARLAPLTPAMPSVPQDEDLADRFATWHGGLGYAWLLLIGLHVVAALWHHLVLRDGVLRAMRQRGASQEPVQTFTDRSPPR